MSQITPNQAEYIKRSVREIIQLTALGAVGVAMGHGLMDHVAERDAELARLEAFINGCTIEGKGKHDDR